ncbi:cytochrome P450 [Aaosphaeria arxii CBS 175.79]|uniref:Cytochrome P450 n=1 Tax=Aaosphaeria arxii CBS 175.79 TaxID=1450172 RepID=A0A6A5XVH0_9PLEO|nr:cytochrome P450 [Aaosphaeria arxii CBS 175.79]KAF2016936.1 cytochrome P450 [Aaosphaeria arxii CBS 175.79]
MPSNLLLPAIVLAAVAYLIKAFYSANTSALSTLPGPWYSKYTNIVLRYHILTGRRIFYVDALHQRYGGVVRIAPREVAVSDISGIAKIHKIGSGFLKSEFYQNLTPTREPGIFAMQDPHAHAARRRLFARAFSNSNLKTNWESEVRSKAELAVQKIKQDAVGSAKGADVLKWWTLMATDVIAHLSFGESFHMLELGKQTGYIDALQAALLSGVLRAELPLVHTLLRYIPTERIQKIVTADDVVFEYGALAIRNMRQGVGNAMNLFGQMVAASDSQEKASLRDEDVRTEAGNLIIAGSDTTAVTLTYLVWAVLNQPQLQADLEREIASLSADLTLSELEDAPLLNSILDEVLRLYGAAPGALPRIVPSQGLSVNGFHIPEGVEVSTQAYTNHRDSSIFPNALQFDGRRFLDKTTMTSQQKAAFMPFGGGSRVCIGLHLAWMELRLGAALFFRHCRGATLSSCMSDDMMEMDNRFLISPKGHCCYIRVEKGGQEEA